jgi:uncharacterized protein (TIGR03382 family)
MRTTAIVCVLAAAWAHQASADTLQVGPDKQYATPSAAAAAASDGDVIEIDAGEYAGDVATWTQNDLTLRGVGGRAHLRADGNHAGGKGTWVIQGDDTTVENIEFSEASVPDENGAGIRQEGAGLTVRNCYFHDNENGILAGDNANSDIVVEMSEFDNNGFGDGQTHNMYINHVRTFTLRYSYSHHAVIGHNVKSRANVSYILFNRIMDEATGTSSYLIDLPNGGTSYVIGNLLHQGENTDNSTMLSYGAEGINNDTDELYVVNNTFVQDRFTGNFVRNDAATTPSVVRNNIMVGAGTTVTGNGDTAGNYVGDAPGFVDRAGYDYRLADGSPAIDMGVAPGMAGSYDLTATSHYVHPLSSGMRTLSGAAMDSGAYELGAPDMPDPDAGPGDDDAGVGNQSDAGGQGGDGDGSGGCCDSTGPGSMASGLLVLALFVMTRRRRDA